MEEFSYKSQKVQERIARVKKNIRLYKKSEGRIRYAYSHLIENKKNCYVPRRIKYSRIPRSEEVFRFTLSNITNQILLLEKELAVLIEYGS